MSWPVLTNLLRPQCCFAQRSVFIEEHLSHIVEVGLQFGFPCALFFQLLLSG